MSPTLPELPEPPAGPAERVTIAMRRLGSAAGADTRVHLRLLIALVVAVVCMSLAPTPWVQVGMVALFLIGLDIARIKRA